MQEKKGSGQAVLDGEACRDGEMIALEGSYYQVKADGQAYAIDKRQRTPFAVVTFFEPNLSQTLAKPMDYETFVAYLDRLVSGETSCYAVRVDGWFEYVKTRSVPRQQKPYPRPWQRSSSTNQPSSFT